MTTIWQEDALLAEACRHPGWVPFHRNCREGADVHFATEFVERGRYRATALRYEKSARGDYYHEIEIAKAEAATPVAATLAAFDAVGLDPSWAAELRGAPAAPEVTVEDLLGDPVADLIG